MLLKRVFHQHKLTRDENGKVIEVQDDAVSHVKVLRAKPHQHFSPGFIEKALAEGWLSIGGGKITIKGETDADSVVYKISATPGYFCCHCNAKLDDGTDAAAHLETAHSGAKSPDEGNPAGYRKDNFYACDKE